VLSDGFVDSITYALIHYNKKALLANLNFTSIQLASWSSSQNFS